MRRTWLREEEVTDHSVQALSVSFYHALLHLVAGNSRYVVGHISCSLSAGVVSTIVVECVQSKITAMTESSNSGGNRA